MLVKCNRFLDQAHTSYDTAIRGCTFLALQRAPIDEIKTHGDWSSDVVYKYIVRPLAERIVSDIHVASPLGEVA